MDRKKIADDLGRLKEHLQNKVVFIHRIWYKVEERDYNTQWTNTYSIKLTKYYKKA